MSTRKTSKTAEKADSESAQNAAMDVSWAEKGSFKVEFVDGLFGETDDATARTLRAIAGGDSPRVILVADSNVVQRTEGLGTRIGRYIQANGIVLAAPPIVMSGGEKLKTDNMQSVQKIVSVALDAKVGKNDVMVALGGGSLLDVAGYAAAQVRGGMPLVRMPTTPAAMVDGAFADTAALNTPNIKDAVRVPCRPAAVLIDTSFSDTVLDGVWRAGSGEIIRQAAVRDSAFMKKLVKSAEALGKRDAAAMDEAIRAAVVSRVSRGSSDFALWSALRLEAMSGYKLPHGYAVAIGVCIDCAYAVERGLLKPDDQEAICRAIADAGALDGLGHSRHLLEQADSVLRGLDAWSLATGSETRTLCVGIGKAKPEPEPDRDAYRKVLQEFIDASDVTVESMV